MRAPSTRVAGAVSLLLSAAFVVLVFSGLIRRPFEARGRTVVADFVRAPQLQKGDQVRIDGDIDGRVADIAPRAGGRGVRVKLNVDKDAGPIYADASARLRVKTLLAGAFYVDLDRGSPDAGPLGASVIPQRRTSIAVEIEDITDVFRGGAVSGLKTTPHELARGLADPAAPAGALDALDRAAPDLAGGLDAVRGQQPGRDLPAVVADTARTVKALDSPTDDLGTLVSGAAATVEETALRRVQLRSILRQGPPVTSRLTSTLARLDRTLDTADGLVAQLQQPAPRVAPTLAELRPALIATSGLLSHARPLLRDLRPAVSALRATAANGTPLIDALRPSLKRTDEQIIPWLGTKDRRTGKSTAVMIGGFAAGFGAIAGQQDQNGHFIRFPASLGTSSPSVYLPCSSSIVDPDAASVLACDSLQQALASYLQYTPLGSTATRKGK